MRKIEKAIYKITNKIDGRVYIGQSVNPEKRFQEHCWKQENYASLIHLAIEKYGKENFNFEILGWYEDYNEKEKYYIKEYNSLAPNGYNIMPGGEEPPHFSGENHPMHKISKEKADLIKEQLMNWKILLKDIVKNNETTSDTVRHIRDGSSWHDDNLSYPLRPEEALLDKYRAKYIQYLCCASTIPLNNIGEVVGWGRSSAKMINQGKNHYDDRLRYPIRQNREYNKEILSQESCIDYLHYGE